MMTDISDLELIDFEAGMLESEAKEAFKRCGLHKELVETSKDALTMLATLKILLVPEAKQIVEEIQNNLEKVLDKTE